MTPPGNDETDIEERIAALGLRLGRAVATGDLAEAARLRAEIDRLADVDPAARHGSRIGRGRPGAMGLGTDQASLRAPKGWKPPPKPDPMTANARPASHRRKGG